MLKLLSGRVLSRLIYPMIATPLAFSVVSAPAQEHIDTASPASHPKSLKDVMSQATAPVEPDADETGMAQEDVGLMMRRQLLNKLKEHPRLNEARANVCSAGYQIRLNKAAYYPKLSVSLSAGDKLVDKTKRADEFGGFNSPEYDGAGLNATLQLRQQIYDWGDAEAGIDLARIQKNLALLERLVVLDEQAAAILRAAMEYAAQDQVLSHYVTASHDLERTLAGIEARFEAGAGTLVELRQAQILKLEHETAVDTATRRRAQSTDVLQKQFDLTPEGAGEIVAVFLAHRDVVPEIIPAEASLQGRIISLELQATEYETNRLEAQRYPKIEGVLVGRACFQRKISAGVNGRPLLRPVAPRHAGGCYGP